MSNIFLNKKVFFYILIRSWKSFPFFDRCIESVLKQKYTNYKIIYIDDASNYTTSQKIYIKNKLTNHIVIFNKIRKYSVKNAYELIYKYAVDKQGIVVILDGDDWFYNHNVLNYLSKIYGNNQVWLTYGNCLYWNGSTYCHVNLQNQQRFNIPYPIKIVEQNLYRKWPFLPLHLRSFKVWLFKRINKFDLLDTNNQWLSYAEDQAMYYPMLEMAGHKSQAVKEILYVYNISNPYRVRMQQPLKQAYSELIIRRKKAYAVIK